MIMQADNNGEESHYAHSKCMFGFCLSLNVVTIINTDKSISY